MTRTLTPAEQRHLTTEQQEYLVKRPNIVSLQPGSMLLPNEQLYSTLRHGAVTIERAMALDAILNAQLTQATMRSSEEPMQDSYSDAEDRFIDRHGMSSRLY